MRTIYAKFTSKCQTTGQTIKKGELIKYDPNTRKAYKVGNEPPETEQSENEREFIALRGYIDAQEEAAIRNGNY
jgi:hypothetical protein